MPDEYADLLTRFVGPILRTYIAALIGILTAHGFSFDSAFEGDLLKVLLAAVPIVAWSIWQKFQAAKLLKAAHLASPQTPMSVVRKEA